MNPLVKLGVYLAVLAAVFGAAFTAGAALDAEDDPVPAGATATTTTPTTTTTIEHDEGHTMPHGEAAP